MNETSNTEYIDNIVQKILDRQQQHVNDIERQMKVNTFFFSFFLISITYFSEKFKISNLLTVGITLLIILALYSIISTTLLKKITSKFEEDLSDLRLESDLQHIAKNLNLEIFSISNAGNTNYFLIGPLIFKRILISNNKFSFELNDLFNIVKNVDNSTLKLEHGEYKDIPITKLIDFIKSDNVSKNMSNEIKKILKYHKLKKLF